MTTPDWMPLWSLPGFLNDEATMTLLELFSNPNVTVAEFTLAEREEMRRALAIAQAVEEVPVQTAAEAAYKREVCDRADELLKEGE